MKIASFGPNASLMVLEWRPWLYQLVSAVVSGGAGAVTTAAISPIMDATKYNPTHWAYYQFIGLMFLGTGFLKLFFFLDIHPIPDIETVTTVQTVEQQEHPPATVTKTVQTTETAPKKEKE